MSDEKEDSGQRKFATGAVRSTSVDHLAYDKIPPIGLRRLAERCKKGEINYPGEYPGLNWLRGLPASDVINHMMAHFEKYRCGDRTEDHLAALAWGAFVLMHYEETMPEMMDVNRYPLRSVNDDGSPRKRTYSSDSRRLEYASCEICGMLKEVSEACELCADRDRIAKEMQ